MNETSDKRGGGGIQVVVDERKPSLVYAEIVPNALENAVLQNDLNGRCVQGRDIEEGAAEVSLKVRECLTSQVRIYLYEYLVA